MNKPFIGAIVCASVFLLQACNEETVQPYVADNTDSDDVGREIEIIPFNTLGNALDEYKLVLPDSGQREALDELNPTPEGEYALTIEESVRVAMTAMDTVSYTLDLGYMKEFSCDAGTQDGTYEITEIVDDESETNQLTFANHRSERTFVDCQGVAPLGIFGDEVYVDGYLKGSRIFDRDQVAVDYETVISLTTDDLYFQRIESDEYLNITGMNFFYIHEDVHTILFVAEIASDALPNGAVATTSVTEIKTNLGERFPFEGSWVVASANGGFIQAEVVSLGLSIQLNNEDPEIFGWDQVADILDN